MGIFPEVEAFVHAHRSCGELTWIANQPSPKGYRLWMACPCGVVFERWVLLQDAEEDLLLSCLGSFPN